MSVMPRVSHMKLDFSHAMMAEIQLEIGMTALSGYFTAQGATLALNTGVRRRRWPQTKPSPRVRLRGHEIASTCRRQSCMRLAGRVALGEQIDDIVGGDLTQRFAIVGRHEEVFATPDDLSRERRYLGTHLHRSTVIG